MVCVFVQLLIPFVVVNFSTWSGIKGPSLVWLRNSCVNVHLLGLHMKFLGQIGRNVLILVYQKVTILTVSTFFECTLMCLHVLLKICRCLRLLVYLHKIFSTVQISLSGNAIWTLSQLSRSTCLSFLCTL